MRLSVRSRVLPLATALTAASSASALSAQAPTITSTPLLDDSALTGMFFVAAGHGRLVAARQTSQGTRTDQTSFFELRAGHPPRFIRSIAGLHGPSTVGTDAAGRAVAVVPRCADLCHLTAIQIDTGRASEIPRTTNATIGAMDRGRVVFARPGPRQGPDLVVALPTRRGASSNTSTGNLARADQDFDPGHPGPEVNGIAVYRGTIAISIAYSTKGRDEGSAVFVRRASGRWKLLARSSYAYEESGDEFGVVRVDASGVRAAFGGGHAGLGSVFSWSRSGLGRKEIRTAPLGISDDWSVAAFAGDDVIVEPAIGSACSRAPAIGDCAPRRVGPLGLD